MFDGISLLIWIVGPLVGLSGLATGVFSSVLGVGGAVLMRPILASGFHVPEREVSVSVRILLLITTLTGGATYLVHDGALQMRVLLLGYLLGFRAYAVRHPRNDR